MRTGQRICSGQPLLLPRLEYKLVRELTLGQPPARLQVLREVLRLRNGGDDRLVHLLLIRRLRLGECLLGLGLALREEPLLSGGTALGGRFSEVGVAELLVGLWLSGKRKITTFIHVFAYLEIAEIHLGGGRNNVCLVYAAEGHAIELVRPSDEKQSARELLEEDDTLPAETAGEEDEDRAGGDARAKLRRLRGLAALLGLADVLGRVEARSLRGRDGALAAVVGTADLHLLGRRDLGRSGRIRLFLALVQPSLGEDLRAGETADT